jgi:mono/diheme cytochrome c family protein
VAYSVRKKEGSVAHTRASVLIAMLGLAVSAGWLAGLALPYAQAQQPKATPPKAAPHGNARRDHEHPPIPAAYANAHIPTEVWTDAKMIAKGKEIYAAKCALCHGEKGDGKGPGAVTLPLKPADLTEGKMVAEMPGNFWVWRVSEGGLVEPFKSKGSVMPAWKGELSMNDRWAVIAYAHTLSGHDGPHVASEHATLKPKPKSVTGEGTVISVALHKQQVVLEHGEIEGFMEAMTMGYKTDPPSLLKTVQPGDRIRFTIDTDARAITKIVKLKN